MHLIINYDQTDIDLYNKKFRIIIENKLSLTPKIKVPTITIDGLMNGVREPKREKNIKSTNGKTNHLKNTNDRITANF